MNDLGLPISDLVDTANAFASANGIQVEKIREDGSSYFECAPMSLLPNAYPRQAFEEAKSLASSFNLLVDKISRDGDFLIQTLGGGVADADPFTAKLLQLYKDVYLNNPNKYAVQADRLGIHRSDYMLNEGQIKQVELNTIASSFAGLSSRVSALHSLLIQRFRDGTQAFLDGNKAIVTQGSDKIGEVPHNPALVNLAKSMASSVQNYVSKFEPKHPVAVLFVVQQGESNTVDQRLLEFELFGHGIPVLRKSLSALHKEMTNKEGVLIVDGSEVALVYFRAGYAPSDYKDGIDGTEWQVRKTLEMSLATKCPCLGYHLAGTKKVQQELSRPQVLERFFPADGVTVAAMRKAFAGLYSLGTDVVESDLAAIQEALTGDGHKNYVLKPQREGGGYNFYGDDLKQKLSQNVTSEGTNIVLSKSLGEYILMQRLFPPEQKAVLLRSGRVEGSGDSISELGCFGTILVSGDGETVHVNEYAGFLLRTKFSHVDEGGVASGFATLSSPYLC